MANQLAPQAASLDPQDFITVNQNQLHTTSLKVAEAFGKRHSYVLDKIQRLDCSEEFASANFSADVQIVEVGNGAKRESKVYEMTKDGFFFLVMGFTGKKAAAVKEAYINAFNWMAEQLSQQPALPEKPTTDPRNEQAAQAALQLLMQWLSIQKFSPSGEYRLKSLVGWEEHAEAFGKQLESGEVPCTLEPAAPVVTPEIHAEATQLLVARAQLHARQDLSDVDHVTAAMTQSLRELGWLKRWRKSGAAEAFITTILPEPVMPKLYEEAKQLLLTRVRLDANYRLADNEYIRRSSEHQMEEAGWAQRWKLL